MSVTLFEPVYGGDRLKPIVVVGGGRTKFIFIYYLRSIHHPLLLLNRIAKIGALKFTEKKFMLRGE